MPNTVTERPILYTGPMVRACLDGSKTQTRRVVTKLPSALLGPFRHVEFRNGAWNFRRRDDWREDGYDMNCPYCAPCDLLYVRETWAAHWGTPPRPVGRVIQSGPVRQPGGTFVEATTEEPLYVYYRADNDSRPYDHVPWKPSIHMPKSFSRLWLRVKDVRVERVQDISFADAIAEGISKVPFRPDDGFPICDGYMVGKDDGVTTLDPSPRDTFERLWDSINEKRGFGWDVNPWVWVVTFEKVDR